MSILGSPGEKNITLQVIGTSPTTGEVLVKDPETGELSWQKGSEEQIERVSKQIQQAPGEKLEQPEPYQAPKAPEPSSTEAFREREEAERREQAGIPKDTEITKFTQEGKPETYKKDGETYYAPGSTMHDIGFRTEKEYDRFQREYDPSQPGGGTSTIAVSTDTPGVKTRISVEDARKLQDLTGKQQFDRMQELGIISKEAIYVPGTGKDWYTLPSETLKQIRQNEPKMYDVLMTKGYEAYKKLSESAEEVRETETKAFEAKHIKLADDKWVAIKDWNEIPEKYQSIGIRKGFDAMLSTIETDRKDFEAKQKEFDQWLSEMPERYQETYKRDGYDKLVAQVDADQKAIEKYRLTSREAGETFMWSGEGPEPMSDKYDLQKAIEHVSQGKIERAQLEAVFGKGTIDNAYKVHLATRPTMAQTGAPPVLTKEEYAKLTAPASFTADQIKAITPFVLTGERKSEVDIQGMMKAGIDPKTIYDYIGGRQTGVSLKDFEWQAKYEAARPDVKAGMLWDKVKQEDPAAPAVIAAEIIVPGVYLKRHWNEMPIWEKAVFIGVDALSVIPVATGAAAGARAVAVAGRGARMLGALRGAGAGVAAIARAPVDMIIHPVATVKGIARTTRSMVENVAHMGKIPEATISTADGLVMLRINKDTTAAQAIRFQEELAKAGKAGEKLILRVGDTTVELAQSPLMREAGGGLVHATPDVAPFAEETKILEKAGLPSKEQGLFVAHQPSIQFALKMGDIPLAETAPGKVQKLAKYKAADLVKLDAAVIKPINLADAKAIPQDLADPLLKQLQALCRKDPATRIGGSFNEWLKVPKAVRPNDLDIATTNARKVQQDIINLAKRLGYEARPSAEKIKVEIRGKGIKNWTSIMDVDTLRHHRSVIPAEFIQPTRKAGGLNLERLGEQYLRQSYASVVKPSVPEQALKIEQRVKKLDKAAGMMIDKLEEAGATIRQRGILIYSPETARQAEATRKTFFSKEAMEAIKQDPTRTAEMEEKFLTEYILPKMQQRLFTRVGPTAERLEIWLERPLSKAQIAKLKAEAIVELIKTPFKPAIKISRAKGGMTPEQTATLKNVLRESGNRRVADLLARADSALSRVAVVPRARATALAPRPSVLRMSPPSLTRTGRIVPARPVGRVADIERLALPERSFRRIDSLRETIRRIELVPAPERTRVQARELEQARARLVRETERAPERAPAERVPERATRIPPERLVTRTPRRVPPRAPRVTVPPGVPPRKPPPGKKPVLRKLKPISLGDKEAMKGAIAWRQGFGWWIVTKPYRDRSHAIFVYGKQAPPGVQVSSPGKRSPHRSIQTVEGKPPARVHIDSGIQDIIITKPTRPGGKPAIAFKADPRQRTRGDFSLRKPGMRLQREGKYYRIPGVGLTRKRPRGRLLR